MANEKTQMSEWHTAESHAPRVVCKVRMEDGSETDALYVDGNWVSHGGEIVSPVKFQVKDVYVFESN